MGQYITLGLNIALLVFVGIGVLFGFIKGLRKSASNGIFLIIMSIILLFVTVPIANALLDIKIKSNITIGDEMINGYASVKDTIQLYVKHYLGASFVESNPEFVSVVSSLPLVFIYAIVYVLLFWVCRLLFLPLNYLFYRLTFAPKKKKEDFGFSAFNDDEKNLTNLNENADVNASDESGVSKQDDTNIENNSSEINNDTSIQQAEENTFGKEGSFIKTEIEEPKLEHVVPVDFDKPKKEKKKKEKIKVKKHRLWGALVGGFVGLFVMLNTLIPVYGTFDILKDVNKVDLKNVTDTNTNLSSQTNDVMNEIIDSYDNSILKTISKYSGIEGLALAEFDFLTTKKINNSKITLRKDINNLVSTINQVDVFVGKYKSYLGSGNWSNLTQEQISGIIKDAKDLLVVAKSVKLVDCVADYLIPLASTYLVNSGIKISDNAIVNEFAIDAISALAESADINVFDEITSLLDLVDYINSEGLLTKILQNDFGDPIAIINSLDADFGQQFINKLYNLKTINLTMPYVLNIGLNYLEQAINYGYEKIVYENIETIKTAFSNIVDRAIAVAKTIDTSSSIYITNESLIPLGKLLQTVKVSGIVNETTYQNLINYAVDELQKLLQGLVPAELEDYFLYEFVENVAKVDNWDFEMTTISNAIRKLRDVENGILGQVVEGEELRSGLDIQIIMKPGVFSNLGESLDILEGTVLFGAKTYKNEHQISGTISMFLSILDYADKAIKDGITNTSLQQVTSVFEKIKTNLIESNHTYNSENKFWTNELNSVAPLIIEVYDMLDSGNFDITTELGKSLDQAKSSTMFGNGATLDLMKVSLDIVSDSILGDTYTYNDGSENPQVLNDKIYELFVAVKDNLSLESTKEQVRLDSQFWQDEFEYYQSLKNIAENSSKLSSISDAKTLATDLDKISQSKTIPQDEIFDIVAFAIKDIKYKDTTDSIELSINDLIDNIANRLESDTYLKGKDLTDFWAIEFDHLSNIMDIKFSDDGEYKLINNLGNIGVELDKVVLGYEVLDNALTTDIDESKSVRASYILNADDLRKVLGVAMDTMASTISSSFSSGRCSELYERYISGYNGTRVNVIYDDCNPFGMIAGDFGEITSLSKHTSQSASESTIVAFNSLSELFATFMGNFEIPTNGTEYIPTVSGNALNSYTQFYNKAIELYNSSLVSFTKNESNDLTRSAVIGVNHPYTMAFGSDVSPELIDFQEVIANLFGFSSKTEFMNYAQILANTYAQHRTNITNSATTNEALDNGCFYTSNGSFVFPIAVKNELSSTVLAYVILDTSGLVSVWVNDITAVLWATNYNSSYHTSSVINNKLYCKNILFVTGPDIQTSVQSALHDIQANILDTTNIKDVSFEKEMKHLQTLANLKVNSSMLSYPTGTESEISAKLLENKQKLSDLGEQLDSIAYAYRLDNDIYKYTDKIDIATSTNSKFITRSILTNLIKDIFGTAKVSIKASDDTNTQEEKTAFNTLITSIQTEMGSIATDKVMSWQRELGYVNNLVQMNSGTTYTINNVAENVGKNLDAIAFNVKTGTQTFDDILYDANNACTYFPTNSGNSLFITRSALKTMMASYLNRLKETIDETNDDEATKIRKNAINTAIDESMNKIADDNGKLSDTDNYYPNFEEGLTALKNLINSL